jgi:hypothetical protein
MDNWPILIRERDNMKAVEITVDGSRNECLSFRPLPGITIRGRFDYQRVAEPLAKLKTEQWPLPIVGQVLGVDENGNGFIREPLHDAEHGATKQRIEKEGWGLPDEMQTFKGIHIPSWHYWMMRAVESGYCSVVKGELPAKISKPRKNFIVREEPTQQEQTNAVMTRLADVLDKLADKLDGWAE